MFGSFVWKRATWYRLCHLTKYDFVFIKISSMLNENGDILSSLSVETRTAYELTDDPEQDQLCRSNRPNLESCTRSNTLYKARNNLALLEPLPAMRYKLQHVASMVRLHCYGGHTFDVWLQMFKHADTFEVCGSKSEEGGRQASLKENIVSQMVRTG